MNNEELRQRNKTSFQNSALFWVNLANQSEFKLNTQLLTLASVFLPISASLVVISIVISIAIKVLLIVIWIFLLTSIVAGLFQNYLDIKYFAYLSIDSSKREVIWSDAGKNIKQAEKETEMLGKVKGANSHLPIIIQAISFLFAFLLIIIIGGILLFSR